MFEQYRSMLFQSGFADLGGDERVTIAVAAHPTAEGEKGARPFDFGEVRFQLRIEGGIELRDCGKNRAVKEEHGVVDLIHGTDPLLPDFDGLPEGLENFVGVLEMARQAENMVERGSAFGFGWMGRKYRFNFEIVEALLKRLGRHSGTAKLSEELSKRLCRLRTGFEMPHTGPFLAQVGKLEEQAERMRYVIGFLGGEASYQFPLRLDARGVMGGADSLGKLPQLLHMREQSQTSSLLAYDRPQPCRNEPYFSP